MEHIPDLLFNSCGALDKWMNLSDPQFPYVIISTLQSFKKKIYKASDSQKFLVQFKSTF